MSERVWRLGVLAVSAWLAAMPGRAQTPPLPSPAAAASPPPPQPFTGFVSSYEIVHTLQAAGLNPLAPPLREGTTYVVRATDYRGILMRVVVDARTGAIRDANRIVPGPGRFGQYYGAPSSPYGPADVDAVMAPPDDGGMEPPSARPPVAPPPAATAPALALPPLPRPRPATLASRKPDGDHDLKVQPPLDPRPDTKTNTKTGVTSGPNAGADHNAAAGPSGAPDAKPEINSQITAAPPPAAAPTKVPVAPPPPLND